MSIDSESAVRTVAKGGAIFLVGLVFSYLAAAAYRLIIARWLGPEEYGLISLGLAIVSLLSGVVGLGLSEGINRFVAYYNAKGEPNKVKGTLYAALKISFPVAILTFLITFFFAEQIAISFFNNAKFIPVLKLVSVVIPLILLMNSCLQVIRAYKKLQYEVYSRNFIENTIKVLATILFLYLGFGLMGAAFAYVLSILIATIASVYFMQWKVRKIFFTSEKAEYDNKSLISYSLPLSLVSLISPVESWIDTIFVGFFLTSASIGIYNAALPIAEITRIFFPALTALTVPIMTEMFAKNNLGDIVSVYRSTSRWIFMGYLPALLLVLLFSEQIIRLLFGEQYIAAASSLIILTIGYFIYAVVGPARQVLSAVGKTKYLLLNYSLALAVGLGGNILLIPKLGIIGAAISTSVSFALVNVLSLIEVNSFIKINPVSKGWIKPLLAALLSLALTYVMARLFIITNLTLIVFFIIFLFLYVSLLFLLRAFEREDIMIFNLVRKKVGI